MIHGRGSQFATKGTQPKPLSEQELQFIEFRADTKEGHNELLKIVRMRVVLIRKRMKEIWKQSDIKNLDEYQELNDKLYQLNIFKAEFEWKRNML